MVSEQPTQGNWIWIQPCEHFNPTGESDFCVFAAGGDVRCLFFVSHSTGFRLSFSACTINIISTTLPFLCSQHFILNWLVNGSNICLCPVPRLHSQQLASIFEYSLENLCTQTACEFTFIFHDGAESAWTWFRVTFSFSGQ